MVMKRNAMRKNLRQSIKRSLGRYIAIAAIIGLGSAVFIGLLMSKTDMLATGQAYVDSLNMFDLRLVSNYGWTEEHVEMAAQLDGISDAEGVHFLDLTATIDDVSQEAVYRFYSIPERINKVELRGGRMPESPAECLADGYLFGDEILGKTVSLSKNNDPDDLEAIIVEQFTVVGYVASPLYMDANRGTTSVGNGRLENYFFIPEDTFDLDYYTQIELTIPGDYEIYSDAYSDILEDTVDRIEADAEMLAKHRFDTLKAEAEEEYADGYQEFQDGLKEYEEGKLEAEQELADALQELQDGEKELENTRRQLNLAETQVREGREELEFGYRQLDAKEAEFKAQKEAALAQMESAKQTLDAQYPAVKEGYDQAVNAVASAQAGFDQVKASIPVDEINGSIADLSSQQEQLKNQLAQTEDPAEAAALQGQIDALGGQIADLQAKLQPYHAAKGQLDAVKAACQPAFDGMAAIERGYAEIESNQQMLAEGEASLASARSELDDMDDQLSHAFYQTMVGWSKWHEGKKELEDGWVEYEEGKLEAEQELADAWKELEEARVELADAREEIDAMEEWRLFILDRNTNVGYSNLDSSSDIVAGVSRVFPVFFILLASLVCITTMTRMIEEERTQIGTLKALGYSNWEIIRKYLVYSGSSALLGCCMGAFLGSTFFPSLIWDAYTNMLYLYPKVVLTVDWLLCVAVTATYTLVMLLVTWYVCRRTLQEEPSELIRPKSPASGKKVLMEYLPFWKYISFLNKVTIRNIFRYRQRLAMMLLGIGGCTALLVTGFGLRDSIVNVVDYQFREVTLYDMEVYFQDAVDDESSRDFETVLPEDAAFMYYHQSSVELEYNDRVKEIYMISADQLDGFLNLHSSELPIPHPGEDEVVLSVGVAQMLELQVGDSVIIRNSDMQPLSLTVSGIYDNHLYNYAIVSPQTVLKQWGDLPEKQMAFVKLTPGQDVHMLSASISGLDDVMNVSISEDMAGMVTRMMNALDLVIVVIVFCAGLLAAIVLYNLTNININERIREIATIKVLGFRAGETGAYVFKENMTLTIVGSLLGLGLGQVLLMFVMSQIKIDMVWFKSMVMPISYVWSFAMTVMAAIIVDFIFYFKLQTINMAEALKSVE